MNLKTVGKIRDKEAFAAYLRREYDASVDEFYAALNAESDRLIRTDLVKARELTDLTRPLETYFPARLRPHLHRIWGRHHHLSGHYRQAGKYYHRAIDLFIRQKDSAGAAKVRKALLDVLMYLGRYEEALAAGRKSLTYFKRTGSEIDCAQVQTNIGNLYHRLDENKKALQYYEPALRIFRKHGIAYAVAIVQFNRGNIYSNLNDIDGAERLYREARDIYHREKMELAAAQCSYSLAYIAFLKGEYSRSLSEFTEVAEDFKRLGDAKCHALTELDRMEVYLHLNLFSDVIAEMDEVASRFEKLGMNYERGKVLYFGACAYYEFGNFIKVKSLLNRARRLFERESNQTWSILCKFLAAKVACQSKKAGPGIKAFDEVASYYKKEGQLRRLLDTRLAQLKALVSSEHVTEASKIIRDIKNSQYTHLASYQQFLFHMLAGDNHQAAQNEAGAIESFKKALTIAQRMQSSIFPDETRRFFWMDKLSAYNRLAAIYLQRGDKKRAFQILASGKVASSLDIPAESSKESRRRIPKNLAAERRRLRSYLRRALLPIGEEHRSAVAAPEIKKTEYRLWKIEKSIRAADYSKRKSKVQAIDAPHIMRRLKTGDLFVQYLYHDNFMGAFVCDKKYFDFVNFEIDQGQLRGLLARLYFLINQRGSGSDNSLIVNNILTELCRAVWDPLVAGRDSIKRVAIITDGLMGRIPFNALISADGTHLYRKFDLYFYASASSIIKSGLPVRLAAPDKRNFVFSASRQELPAAAEEGRAVAKNLPHARIYNGRAAGSAAFFEALASEGSLVHVAAHAAHSYENYMFSQLLLGDGPVYPFDILMRPVGAELVVLSGCQTGDSGLFYYGHTASLAQAFLDAGVKNVIASLWTVSDEFARRFMTRFYEMLADGRSISDALRGSMNNIREESGNIRDWSSFHVYCR